MTRALIPPLPVFRDREALANHAANLHHFTRAMPEDARAMRELERSAVAVWREHRRMVIA